MTVTEPLLTWSVTASPSQALVALIGEIDMTVADVLSDVLTGAANQHPGIAVNVDMARVSFMDSTGIRVFVAASRQPADGY